MLRFEIVDNNERSIDGIFFESDWDDNIYQLLRGKDTIKILAKVSEFQNKLSLTLASFNKGHPMHFENRILGNNLLLLK